MKTSYKILLSSILVLSACSNAPDTTESHSQNSDLASIKQSILSTSKTQLFNLNVLSSIAAIYIHDFPDYSDQVICSGTLITPRHVLTAAHCVANLSNQYALYSEDPSDPTCRWTGSSYSVGTKPLFDYLSVGFTRYVSTEVPVKRVVYHSGYAHTIEATACLETGFDGYEITQNDIAILELAEDVNLEFTKPLPILPPWLGISQDQIASGMKGIFAGFGYNQDGIKGLRDRQSLALTMYCPPDSPNIYCTYDQALQITGCHPNVASCAKFGYLDYIDNRIAVPQNAFFYLQHGEGPCTGDSGGPMLIRVGNQYYVAGITSYGDNACKNYGVSMAVQDYYDWIVKNVPEVANYNVEICNNGIDDDNNGLTDHLDPACANVPYCGDGLLSEKELCEGDQFFNDINRCADWDTRYESGLVTCNSDCTLNYSQCVAYPKLETCGNGVLDEAEACDGEFYRIFGEVLTTNSCNEFSAYFTGGMLSCNDNCTIDTTQCTADENDEAVCGNGIREENEECDGPFFTNAETLNCSSWDPWYIGGEVSCTDTCKLDWSQCLTGSICGDHKVTGDEPCDNNQFMGNATYCTDWSNAFTDDDIVHCNPNCSIDFSSCTLKPERAALCGNGKLEEIIVENQTRIPAEDCDGDLFAKGDDCAAWDSRYSAGKVTCTNVCTVNYSKCILKEADNAPDEGYAMVHALATEPKPTAKIPVKSSDSVWFTAGSADQKEKLTYEPSAPEPSKPNPDKTPDPGDEQPQMPETPAQSSDDGCSAAPSTLATHGPYWLIFALCGLVFRRRYLRRQA